MEDQDEADDDEYSERGSTLRHEACGTHSPCQIGLIDNTKSHMLEWRRISSLVKRILLG